jgi:hypothetical protein
MRTRKQRGNALVSRRRVIRALGGAAALAGLPRYGAASTSLASATVADGYTDQQSYVAGDRVTLFLNATTPQRAVVNVYDYTGRTVHQITADLNSQQPLGSAPWETGFGYQESVSFTLPRWRSGVYLVEGKIPLIVRDSPLKSVLKQSDIVVLYPTNTIAAYNTSGGRSMYSEPVPAPIVSFHRPSGDGSNLAFFSATLEWFAGMKLPYTMGYVADIDLEDYSAIDGTKLLVVIGHSEYWTRRARENFDQFVLRGGNVLVLSGNTMWWQVRYSDDKSQMICYKLVHDPYPERLLHTINWTAKSLEYPTTLSVGTDFPRGGFGTAYPHAGGFTVVSPTSPVFKGIYIRSGDVITIPTVEYDGAPLLNSPATSGEPRLDMDALGAYRAEIIGYEYCSGNDNETGPGRVAGNVATWLVYQRTASSGIVMNGASTNWCSRTGAFGQDGFRVRQIIVNMIDILVNKLPVFTG